MGVEMLPTELQLMLSEQWPCRDEQVKQLSALLSPRQSSAPTLVVYGPPSSGKSGVLRYYLDAVGLRHAIVQSRECVTGRHLLEKTTAAVHESISAGTTNGDAREYDGRCENVSALVVHLQRLLKSEDKFVLVFDGADKQRDAPPTLLPALARLGEFIPNLTTLLVVNHPSPRFLHQSGIPHLHFPPYSRNQSIHILVQKPPDIFLQPPPDIDYDADVHEEDKAWLWPRFCAAVWDSLGQNVARDLSSYRDVCHKLWRPFVTPIVKGDFGTRDFSRLLVNQRKLFQDENVLLDSILLPITEPLDLLYPPPKRELPYYARWLLIAAYLASYNPPRMDTLYFMKSTERKRRKKGGGTARSGGRPSQTRKVARHLLAPSQFTLDRLLAILHAILPHDFRSTTDVYAQISTLAGLRLLVRGGGIGSADALEPGSKWRVGATVTWEFVQGLARGLRFDVVDYAVE